MKSLLDYEGVSKTQNQIASEVWSTQKALPWYTVNGSEKSQFPAATHMSDYTGFNYIPFPYGAAGTSNLTASDIEPKVMATINNGHGLLVCGRSYGNIKDHASILPNYPAKEVGHWLACDGYKDNGATIWLVDPAKSDCVSWSGNITRYLSVSSSKLAAYANARGIIW